MPRLALSSLRSRLLLLLLLSVLPILGVTLYTNAELRRVAAADAKKEALRLVRIAANDQRDTIRDTQQLLYALAHLPELQTPETETCTDLLSGLLAQYPQYTVLALALPDGRLVCATPSEAFERDDLTERAAFHKVRQSQDFAVEASLGDEIGDAATLDMAYPVIDEANEVTAVAFASLDLAWLNQLAAEAQLPEGSSLTVIDSGGVVLVRYPDPQDWIGKTLSESPLLDAIRAQGGQGTIEAAGLDGTTRLFAFVPLLDGVGDGNLGDSHLYVSIGIPKSVAFSDTDRVLLRNLLALGAVSVIALGAAWMGSDIFILRRVHRLVDVASRLGEGDMSARTDLAYEGELGQLARAFDRMAESLTARISERDRAETALRESRRALYTLMSNLPGMAYRRSVDPSWTMEFVSEGCVDLTGYGADALTADGGVTYGLLVHPEDRDETYQEIRKALGEHRPFEVIYRITTAGGQVKWVWDKGRGVLLGENGLAAIEGFVSDITEGVRVQQLLEQRVADRTRELSALYDVMAVLNASMDLDTMLESSLERILMVLDSESGAIYLLGEEGSALRLAASAGASANLVDTIGISGSASRPANHKVVRREAVSPADGENLALHPLLRSPAVSGRSYLGVPLRSKGRVLGTLGLARSGRHPFQEEEASLAGLIADELGVALENTQLQQQARQLAVLQERERLARELHDSVTQSLYSLTLLAEAGRQRARAGDTERVSHYLERLGDIGQQALKEMRLLVYELRPLVLRREGLAGALQQRLDAVEKRAGVEARLLVEGGSPTEWSALPSTVETALYRIALEALNNALKHAGASEVTVRLCLDSEGAMLEVIDNGTGFDLDVRNGNGGLGLVSMRERAEQIGAELDIQTAPGQGTRVRVWVSSRAFQDLRERLS